MRWWDLPKNKTQQIQATWRNRTTRAGAAEALLVETILLWRNPLPSDQIPGMTWMCLKYQHLPWYSTPQEFHASFKISNANTKSDSSAPLVRPHENISQKNAMKSKQTPYILGLHKAYGEATIRLGLFLPNRHSTFPYFSSFLCQQ